MNSGGLVISPNFMMATQTLVNYMSTADWGAFYSYMYREVISVYGTQVVLAADVGGVSSVTYQQVC